MLSKRFRCSDCGSLEGYRSRAKGVIEKFFLPLLFLRPVRCAHCFRRGYRLLTVEVRDRNASGVEHHAAA